MLLTLSHEHKVRSQNVFNAFVDHGSFVQQTLLAVPMNIDSQKVLRTGQDLNGPVEKSSASCERNSDDLSRFTSLVFVEICFSALYAILNARKINQQSPF